MFSIPSTKTVNEVYEWLEEQLTNLHQMTLGPQYTYQSFTFTDIRGRIKSPKGKNDPSYFPVFRWIQ